MALKENYVDDILNTSKNTKRKYNMITNADGTVSFEDVTEYSQNGDNFGSADVNAITKAINELAAIGITVRYNQENGYLEVKDGSVWKKTDVKTIGLKKYLFSANNNEAEFAVTNKYTISTVQNFFNGTFTVNDNSMTMQVANSNGAGSYNVISKKIDITSFSKLVFSHNTTISSATEYNIVALWIADKLVESGRTFPVLRNNYLINGTASNGTVECDVSNLEGEVYIGITIQLNKNGLSAKTTITEMYLE